jgi:hypothetical protein
VVDPRTTVTASDETLRVYVAGSPRNCREAARAAADAAWIGFMKVSPKTSRRMVRTRMRRKGAARRLREERFRVDDGVGDNERDAVEVDRVRGW